MSTAILQIKDGTSGREAVCRYFGEGSALAENDTIGITVGVETYLHTVPAGGQTLFQAVAALMAAMNAAGIYGGVYAPNDPADVCINVVTNGTDLSLPVFTVA